MLPGNRYQFLLITNNEMVILTNDPPFLYRSKHALRVILSGTLLYIVILYVKKIATENTSFCIQLNCSDLGLYWSTA